MGDYIGIMEKKMETTIWYIGGPKLPLPLPVLELLRHDGSQVLVLQLLHLYRNTKLLHYMYCHDITTLL